MFADGAPDVPTLAAWTQNLFYFGGFVCALIATVAHVYSVLKKSTPSPDSEYVTQGELRREVGRVDQEVKELRAYVQQRTHDLSNKLHSINIRIVWIQTLISQICAKLEIPVPAEPNISTKDEA